MKIPNLAGKTHAGFTVIGTRPASAEDKEVHTIILAQDVDSKKCVTWVYNSQTNSFALGHYFETAKKGKGKKKMESPLRQALDDFNTRDGKK